MQLSLLFAPILFMFSLMSSATDIYSLELMESYHDDLGNVEMRIIRNEDKKPNELVMLFDNKELHFTIISTQETYCGCKTYKGSAAQPPRLSIEFADMSNCLCKNNRNKPARLSVMREEPSIIQHFEARLKK